MEMKKIYSRLLVLFIMFTMCVGCTSIIEEDLNAKLEDLDNRVTALEELCKKTNTNIASIQTILGALTSNNFITGVTPVDEAGVTIGYTISFASGESITIYNGTDGEDGYIPQISASQDEDGAYYWKIDGHWIYDENNEKIQAENIVPTFKIEDEYWFVSYDNGKTWERLEKATGEDGESILLSVEQAEGHVTFTLADGTTVTIPKAAEMSINIKEGENLACMAGQSIYVEYELSGVYGEYDMESIGGNGWRAEVERVGEFSGRIKVTAPDPIAPAKVIVVLSNRLGQSVMKSLSFENGRLILVSDAYRVNWAGGEIRVPVRTNLEYEVRVPDNKKWLTYIQTKAMRNDTLLFSLAKYPGENPIRMAEVELLSNAGSVLETITIAQLSEPTGNAIHFADSVAKQACIAAGLDVNGDGEISGKEAAETEWLPDWMFSSFSNVRSFDELQYFTKIEYLPYGMFSGCTILESVIIPNNVKFLRGWTFSECRSLVSIDLPNSIEDFGDGYNFRYCVSLKSLQIPEKVTRVGNDEFFGCENLTQMQIHSNINELGWNAFAECVNLTDITLHDNITDIYGSCFRGCLSLQNVELSKGLRYLSENLFQDCICLEEIEIPSSVTSLGYGCFWGCTALETIHIPESVTEVSDAILAGNNLKSITGKYVTPDGLYLKDGNAIKAVVGGVKRAFIIPEDVVSICDRAFWRSSAESVILNKNLQFIGHSAFAETELEEIFIPEKVVTIADGAFCDTRMLERVVFADSIKLLHWGNNCFSSSALTQISIPKTLESIGAWSLSGCYNLKELVFPKNITVIPEGICWGAGIESVTFEGAVTVIEGSAFGSTQLKQIKIPQTVHAIGQDAFNYCYNLEKVYCYPKAVPGLGNNVFMRESYMPKLVIYVPKSSIGDYKSHPAWEDYKSWLQPM